MNARTPAILGMLALLILTSPLSAATYHVRPDGGSALQCDGLSDAPYPGGGENQACAWAHPFWALFPGDPPIWRIQGGDTLIIHPGSYPMGFGAPNSEWCYAEGAFDCHLPPLPSGPDADHPTRLLGAGWDQGCAHPPELWGTQRPWQVISLAGTSHAQIRCLDITDHDSCIESYLSDPAVSCRRDVYPYGDWADYGIYAADSTDVLLKDLDIHGLAHGGIHAGRISDWTVEDVRIAANGWVGWDGDIDGGDGNSGTLVFRRWTVEWNGCGETYPDRQPHHCWGQSAGGYGDGVGTNDTGGHWIIEDSIFRHNTSDGLDLLYLGSDQQETMAEVRRCLAQGNAGNPIKVAGSARVENSVMIADCGFFDQKDFAPHMTDHCRAGGNALALAPHRGSVIDVVNCTITGQSDVLVEVECRGNCDGTEQVSLYNNVFRGEADFLQPGDQTAFLWEDREGYTSGRIDYNVIAHVKFGGPECPFGAHDICAEPHFLNSDLAHFDGHLQTGSPAIDSGLPVGSLGLVPDLDLEGRPRPQGAGVDRGAYEGAATGGAGLASLSGLLTTAFAGHENLSVENAVISLLGDGGSLYVPTIYRNGSFTFADLEPGAYTLRITAPQLSPRSQPVTLAPGENRTLAVAPMSLMFDLDGDGREGLAEAVHALRVVSGALP
jgi:hypothetical protein